MNQPNILFLDVETTPNVVYTFDLFNAFIGQEKIIEPSRLLCWSASWLDNDEIIFHSERNGRKKMISSIYSLINDADIVVTYNGVKFDMKVLNSEFMKEGYGPPKPVESVDLYKVVKKCFRMPSNKLAYIIKTLKLGEKGQEGHDVWVGCLNDDDESWSKMEKYNKNDVRILKKLYKKLQGWVPRHPNHGLYTESETPVCPNCGSGNVTKRGFRYTRTKVYRRYKCGESNCGSWSSSRLSERREDKSVLA